MQSNTGHGLPLNPPMGLSLTTRPQPMDARSFERTASVLPGEFHCPKKSWWALCRQRWTGRKERLLKPTRISYWMWKKSENSVPFWMWLFKQCPSCTKRLLFDSFLTLFENKLFPSYSRIQIAIDKNQGLSLFRIPNFDQGARIGRETVIFVHLKGPNSHFISPQQPLLSWGLNYPWKQVGTPFRTIAIEDS